ncbi:hypothetical protein CHLRE_16g655500v5 [Chlamydomonas reinhardtii]|uniref:Uncharacterized protein n=1 Tax=Chlamydomonas reinhardtii TaxID=3055 RepID=A0A2K3CT53_CHLRE|nr:uncharacterized protein CHLRE_16g655500v5 [Chlamydomonas reinhardtii]PNW71467.1 hypothetical protein CHLRE_16g655500v5 [Chlamydomonas reinhardtii]
MACVTCVDLASLLLCEAHAEHASGTSAAAASISFKVSVDTQQQCWAEPRQERSPGSTGGEHRSLIDARPRQIVCRGWLRPGVRRLLTALQPHYHTALLVRACCCSSSEGCGVSGICSSSSARYARRGSGGVAGSSDCGGSSTCGSVNTSASGDRSVRSSSCSTGRSSSGSGSGNGSGSAAPHGSTPGGALRGCGCGGLGYGTGTDPTEFVTALLGAALPALDPDGTLFGDRIFVIIGARDARDTAALHLLSGASPLASSSAMAATTASTALASLLLEPPSAVPAQHMAPGRVFSTLRDLHALAEALTVAQQQCVPLPQAQAASALGGRSPSATAAPVVVVTTSDRFMFGPLIDNVIECQPYRTEYGMYDDVLDTLATALCAPGGAVAAAKGGAAEVAAALRRCGLAPGRLQPSPVMQALRAQLAIKAATAASASSRAGGSSGSSSSGCGGSGSGAAGGGRDPRAMARLVEVLAAAAADPLRAVRERQQQSSRGPQPRSSKSAGGAGPRQPPRSVSASERRSGSGSTEAMAREDMRLQHMPKPLRSLGGRVSRSTGDLSTVSSAPGALMWQPPRSGGGAGPLRERRSAGRRSSSPPPHFFLPPIPEQPQLEHLVEPGSASCPASPSRCASGSLALALVPPDPALAVAATAAAAAAAAALSGRCRAPNTAGGAVATAKGGAAAGRWAAEVPALALRDMAPSPVGLLSAALALPTACASAPPSDTASVCTPKSRATTGGALSTPPLSPTSPLSPLALASPLSTLGSAAGAAGRSGRSIGSSFTSALAAAAAAMLPSVGSSGSHVHSRSGAGRTELESRPNSFPSALKPPAARFATASSSSRVFPGSGTGFGPGSASGGPSPTGSGLRGRSVSSTGIAALPGAGTGGSAASGNASPGASLTAAASALRVATSRLWSRLLGGNSRKSRASRSCSTVAASPAATPTAALAAELANDCTAGSFSMASAGAVAAGASMAAVNGGSSGAGGEDPAEVLLPPSPFSSLRVQEACAPALAAACAAAAAAGTVGNKTSVATTMSAPASALGTASSGVACKSPQRRALDQPLASAPAAVMSPVTSQAAAAAEASGALPVVTPISRRDAALASEALFVASHIDEVLAAALSEAEGVPPTSAASLVASVERTSVFVERSSSGVCAGSNSGRSSPVRGPAAGTAISRSLSGQEQALLCAQPLFARAAAAARSLEHPRLRDAVQEAVRRYLNPRRGSVRDALVAVVDVAAEGEGRLHDAAYAAAADVAAVAATAAARCRS